MKRMILRTVAGLCAGIMILLSCSFAVSAETAFTPRSKLPSSSEDAYKYYYDGEYNIFVKYGMGLPNCTAYAWGRAYEIIGSRPNLNTHDANKWYDFNKDNNYYPYGQTPKLGAIACWKNAADTTGHVAVVEQISSSTVILSESWYGKKDFNICTCNIDTMEYYSTGYIFQGYIYILSDGVSTGDISDDSGDYSDYSIGNYVVTASQLMIRKTASATGDIIGAVVKDTEVSVTKLSGAWGYVTVNGIGGWISLEYAKAVSSSFYSTGKYEVTAAPYANIRASAAADSSIMGELKTGTVVTVTSVSGKWGHIENGDVSGWINLEYTKKAKEEYAAGVYYVTAEPYLRIRSEPDLNGSVSGYVYNGMIVNVTKVDGDWGCILNNGVEGWICLEYAEYRAKESAFDDVPGDSWYTDAVNFVYESGCFKGVSDSSFAPEMCMTRAMFVQVLSSLAGVKTSEFSTSRFNDVPSDSWYAGAVAWAYENAITDGVSRHLFEPETTITREQLCLMLCKYAKLKGIEINGSLSPSEDFSDADSISSWASSAVDAAKRAGLISGKPGNLCDPQGVATRAEVAQIIMQFVTHFE